jgi:leader peptidase (prepilin peptidase)/N-methyltransferase
VSVAAGVVGVVVGVAAGPVADRIATNATAKRGLLAAVPRSRWLPLLTAATVSLFAASGVVYGFTLEAAIAAFFCFVLVVVTRTDLERRLIPNRVVVPGTVVVLVLRTLDEPSPAWAIAMLAAGAVLLVAALVYPPGLGMGDVKLAAFLGAGLGAAVVLIVRHGRAARKKGIPLGPFLALGGVVALFAGDAILDWYLNS